MNRFALPLLCAALLVPALAAAHDNPEGDAHWDACRADAQKLCKDVEPGGGRIMRCLKEHEDELSPGCRAKGKREAAGPDAKGMEACRADKEKLCAGVEPGEGRVVDCMRAHKDDLSGACREVMAKKGDFKGKKTPHEDPKPKDAE